MGANHGKGGGGEVTDAITILWGLIGLMAPLVSHRIGYRQGYRHGLQQGWDDGVNHGWDSRTRIAMDREAKDRAMRSN